MFSLQIEDKVSAQSAEYREQAEARRALRQHKVAVRRTWAQLGLTDLERLFTGCESVILTGTRVITGRYGVSS